MFGTLFISDICEKEQFHVLKLLYRILLKLKRTQIIKTLNMMERGYSIALQHRKEGIDGKLER